MTFIPSDFNGNLKACATRKKGFFLQMGKFAPLKGKARATRVGKSNFPTAFSTFQRFKKRNEKDQAVGFIFLYFSNTDL